MDFVTILLYGSVVLLGVLVVLMVALLVRTLLSRERPPVSRSRSLRRLWLGVFLFLAWTAFLVTGLAWGSFEQSPLELVVIALGYVVAVGITVQELRRSST